MGTSDPNNLPTPPTNNGVEGDSGLLAEDEFALKKDVKLMQRAVRERWGVPKHRRKPIVDRLCDIAESNPDDELAVSATRVLVTMDQTDMHALEIIDKQQRLDAGQATENVQQAVRIIIE
jgi:hypothetical protein